MQVYLWHWLHEPAEEDVEGEVGRNGPGFAYSGPVCGGRLNGLYGKADRLTQWMNFPQFPCKQEVLWGTFVKNCLPSHPLPPVSGQMLIGTFGLCQAAGKQDSYPMDKGGQQQDSGNVEGVEFGHV